MAASLFSIDDRNTKLDSTICFYKDEPYLIKTINPEAHLVTGYKLPTSLNSKPVTLDYTDDDFDYNLNRPLGWYYDSSKRAEYLSIKPLPVSTLGLKRNQISFSHVPVDIMSKAFYNCLVGKYHTYREAIKEAVEECTTVPFSRECAIMYINPNVCEILLKETAVAIVDTRTYEVILKGSSNQKVLKRILSMNGVELT